MRNCVLISETWLSFEINNTFSPFEIKLIIIVTRYVLLPHPECAAKAEIVPCFNPNKLLLIKGNVEIISPLISLPASAKLTPISSWFSSLSMNSSSKST